MNGKQRARWIADIISDTQRAAKQSRGEPEEKHLVDALECLRLAREAALGSSPARDRLGE
jgi:hypothetical protein